MDRRPTMLSGVTVESSGYDTVTYDYDYNEPVVHSEGLFLIGFGSTRRIAPLLTEDVGFYNDDDLSGIVLSNLQQDKHSAYSRFAESRYEMGSLSGIPFMRPTLGQSGFRSDDGSQEVETTTEYLEYDREVCATKRKVTTPHGTLTKISVLSDVAALGDALHCLTSSEQLIGEHTDTSLYFDYKAEIKRNAVGQLTSITALGNQGPLVLQEVTYDSFYRIESISQAGQGTTSVTYNAETGVLEKLIAPEGVTMQVRDFDPVSDAIRELQSNRGVDGVFTGFYRYDGLDRLHRTWDDLGGSSESAPLQETSYQYASATQPAHIHISKLLDASGIQQESAQLFTAAGEEIATALRIPNAWSLGNLVERSRQQGETKGFYRSPLVVDDIGTITHDELASSAILLSVDGVSGFGYSVRNWQTVQQNVERIVEGAQQIENSAVIHTSSENSSYVTRTASDADGNVLWFENQAGDITSYTYDALGRVVGITLADDQQQRLRYDSYGRPAWIQRDGVAEITYHYDPDTGLATKKSYSTLAGKLERTVSWERDAIGRVTTATHQLAETNTTQTFRYEYDGQIEDEATIPGQLGFLSRVSGEGFERRSRYDAEGQVRETTLIFPDWRSLLQKKDYYEDGTVRTVTVTVRDAAGQDLESVHQEYVYDAWGRLSTVNIDDNKLISLIYDSEGKMERADLSTGGAIVFHYDPVTRNSSGYWEDAIAWNGGVDFQFSDRGLIDREDISFNDDYWQRQYSYDERGFLSGATDEQYSSSYTYTTIGLPKGITDLSGNKTLTRDGAHLDAGGVVYEYDDLGRVVRKGDLILEYGPTGELDAAHRGDQTWRYIYDEAGNRLVKLEGDQPVAAYVAGGYLDENGLILPVRIGGRIVGIIENGQFELLATDPRGTLLGEKGTPNLPTPYGVRTTRPDLAAALDYVAKGYDSDLETVRMGARDYDPHISQFWTPDPLFLESMEKCVESPVECNLYAYAGNNPLNYVDPSGTLFFTVAMGGVAVVGYLLVWESTANAPTSADEALHNSITTREMVERGASVAATEVTGSILLKLAFRTAKRAAGALVRKVAEELVPQPRGTGSAAAEGPAILILAEWRL